MKRKLSALWLAGVVMLAIGAAPAGATTHTPHGEVEPIVVTAQQESTIIFSLSTESYMTCNVVRIIGTAIEETQEFQASTELEECTYKPFGFEVVTETAGCTNVTDGVTDEEGHAHVKLECEEEKAIHATAAGCKITISPQEYGGGVSFENLGEGSEREVLVTLTLLEMAYTSSGGFACFLAGIPAEGNASMTGSALAKGYEDPGGEFEGPPYEEGAQVGVWFE